MSTTTTEQATTARHRRRDLVGRLALVVLYVAPVFLTIGLLRAVAANWHACTGSDVLSAAYHQFALLLLVVTPVACYVAAGLLRLVWHGEGLHVRAGRLVAAYAVVSAVFLFFTARYYSLTQFDCVDGIATWWPFPAW